MARWLPLILASFLFGFVALGQGSQLYDSPAETRAALRAALQEREQAEARSQRFEQEAQQAGDAAERAAREAAALAARIQVAEAGIAAAEARIELIEGERALLREELGQEQQPLVKLTAALQQFTRRPLVLSVLRPGEVRDVVYLRAVMSSTVPAVEARTVDLRGRISRGRQLQQEAEEAASMLRVEETSLAERRSELAAVETRERLAAQQAEGGASREAERALALAEEARDLDSLVGELDRAAELRQRLAALPGPVLRPADGEVAPASADAALAEIPSERLTAPSPYILPVSGRAVTGFGAPVDAGLSQGLVLAPIGGAQVVAPADGRVAFAGPYRGYGEIVIIEHGGGWTSLVTGLARSNVRVGEELLGGAPIGTAGEGRPTVGVELRQGGEAVNPLEFTG